MWSPPLSIETAFGAGYEPNEYGLGKYVGDVQLSAFIHHSIVKSTPGTRADVGVGVGVDVVTGVAVGVLVGVTVGVLVGVGVIVGVLVGVLVGVGDGVGVGVGSTIVPQLIK